MVERKGSVFGIITLIIGIAGLGLGGYSLYSNLQILNQTNVQEENQSITRVFKSGSTVISENTWWKIDFDVLDFDVYNNFNIITDVFNCTNPDYYQISGLITFVLLQDGEEAYAAIVKNNAINEAINIVHASNTGAISTGVVDIVYLSEGDTIELQTYHTGSGGRGVYGSPNGVYTYLSIAFIGNPN